MRASRVVGGLATLLLWSVGGVSAASRSGNTVTEIVADVDGHPIKPSLIASFYCHDFDYPRIHCFRSAAELEDSKSTNAASLAAVSPAFGAGDYVTIFDGQSYSGAFMDVSQNYDALFSIGWNDRISSFKGRNSAFGIFWTDWFASGTARSFCCNTNTSSLPSNLDNTFSSMYRQ